jgi:hypothetical protein
VTALLQAMIQKYPAISNALFALSRAKFPRSPHVAMYSVGGVLLIGAEQSLNAHFVGKQSLQSDYFHS